MSDQNQTISMIAAAFVDEVLEGNKGGARFPDREAMIEAVKQMISRHHQATQTTEN